jgi:hypothetical protein
MKQASGNGPEGHSGARMKRMPAKDFQDLIVPVCVRTRTDRWQNEMYGLTSQIRRAVISIPDNSEFFLKNVIEIIYKQ